MTKKSEHIDYLYDFIYADTRRIYSYLSQIDPTGVVTAIKEITSESDLGMAHGEIGAKIFKAALKGQSSNSQSLEHQFDATPTLPWSLINLLDKNGYLNLGLEQTRIGGLVRLKGNLGLVDVRFMREVWGPITEAWFIENEQRIDALIKNAKNEDLKTLKAEKAALNSKIIYERALVSLLEKLPHTVNMTFYSENNYFWSSLSPANFLFDPEDLLFKHGPNIPGTWYVVAILDAEPTRATVDPGQLPEDSDFRKLTDHVTKFLQFRFGRPSDHYAVTPIAIYRAIQRPDV